MRWHTFKISTRLLIGYGLNLVLIIALGLLFITRTSMLNTRIQRLSIEVAGETTTSSQLATRVAVTQQALDRYLQHPGPETRRTVTDELALLSDAATQAETVLATGEQAQRQRDLAKQLLIYRSTFNSLSRWIDIQATLRSDASQSLLDEWLEINTYETTAPN